ncbi:MAG: glycosyltransferase family 9 protein [Pseudobdellovibrionaceae bacterium]
MKHIQHLWPEDELHLICRKGFGDFFLKTNLVDQVFELDKKSKINTQQVLGKMEKIRYENLFCPHQSVRTALLTRKINAKNKISFHEKWNSVFFQKRVGRQKHLPDALRQLSLLIPLDMDLSEDFANYVGERRLPQISLPEPGTSNKDAHVPEWASMGLRNHFLQNAQVFDELKNKFGIQPGPYAVIAPGSVWETKRWTVEGFAAVTEETVKRGIHVLLVGTQGERSICEQVAKKIPNTTVLAGKTSLYETTHLIAHASFVLSNDSGAMHMASVAETPTVAVFGPTVLPLGYRPWQNHAIVVERENLSCRPCGKHGHHKCPIGTHICMKSVLPQAVLEAIDSLKR